MNEIVALHPESQFTLPQNNKFLITIHSQKGGVGKTFIAYYLALKLASSGIQTVLVDADLTGTSLADVLPLEAIPFDAAKGERLDAEQTLERMRNKYQGRTSIEGENSSDFAFLNHYLLCEPLEYCEVFKPGSQARLRLDNLLWKHQGVQELSVVPSSAYPKDVHEIIPHVYREETTAYFQSRLKDLVWVLMHGWDIEDKNKEPILKQTSDVVIIDTPPGLHGMSPAVIKLHKDLKEQWNIVKDNSDEAQEEKLQSRVVIVHGPDIQDLVAAVRTLLNADWHEPSRKGEFFTVINRYLTTERSSDNPSEEIPRRETFNDETYSLDDPPQARKYFHDRIIHRVKLEVSELETASDKLKTTEELYRTPFLIPYTRAAASIFSRAKLELGTIDELNSFLRNQLLKVSNDDRKT